ncbi:hypothetical protein SAMN05216262_10984 [Colwellia chukchiensis]|uniref:VanZ like family protein n=1 Tax=Colwellia chukchiensis TaxID=641665 RepID=A0A1H7PDL1_9GAMM|nr:multidrug resistance efflux transporter family protein [Colwellia chukchiensis]SEL33851.1 hypothetical protein SAMN05216262_10984 [Colwellia chukchiensis]
MIIVNKKSENLAFLVVLGVLLILLVHYFRDNYKTGSTISLLLGVAPNFITAFCFPAVFIGFKNKIEKYRGKINPFKWFTFCTLLCLIILICWEFRQAELDNFVFDKNDILASIFGAILFLFCWPFLRGFVKPA